MIRARSSRRNLEAELDAISRDIARAESEAGVFSDRTRVSRQWTTSSQGGKPPRLQHHYKAQRWRNFQPPEEGQLAFEGDEGEGALVRVSRDWVEDIVLRRMEADGQDPVEAALGQLDALATQAGLSLRERQVLRLKVENPDWSDAEVGRTLGLKGSTVRVLAHRARLKLIPRLPPEMVRRAARMVGRSRLRRGRFVVHVNGDRQLVRAEESAEPTHQRGDT